MAHDGWSRYFSVSNWTGITAIAAGAWHVVGLKEDGTVVAVGQSPFGAVDVWGWTDIRQPCVAPETPTEVTQVIDNMLASGQITDSGIASALIASLDNAQRNLETSPVSAKNMIEATINKVEAQAGKKISAEAAEKLIRYLNGIITGL